MAFTNDRLLYQENIIKPGIYTLLGKWSYTPEDGVMVAVEVSEDWCWEVADPRVQNAYYDYISGIVI